MSSIRNRFATVLLLIIILAACAQAHPNGGDESFDNNMEWTWELFGSVGDQFADAVAYNHFNTQLISASRPANRRSNTSPPRHARPQREVQAQRLHPLTTSNNAEYFSFNNLESGSIMQAQSHTNTLRSAPILPFVQEQFPGTHRCSGADTEPWVNDQRASQLQPQGYVEGTIAPGFQASFESVPIPANAANMYGYPDAPQAHQQWVTSCYPTHSIPQSVIQGLNAEQFDAAQQGPLPLMEDQFDHGQSQPTTGDPQILPTEVTSNPNYQPGIVSDAPGMLGWLRRAPTIGERTLPSRLDTNMLAPPEATSANRSPTSASTTGSSTRGGSRRHREEMTGDFICHWCNAGFTTQGDLTHHLRSHQPYLSRQHVCQHCDKRFQYRKDLTRHLPKHDPNRKRFYCVFKGCKYHTRGFGRQDHLDRHIQTQHRIDTPMQASRPSSTHA